MTAVHVAITLLSWASSFVAIAIALEDYSAGSIVLLRCATSAAIAWAALLPRLGLSGLIRISRMDLVRLAIMALVGAALYNVLLAEGQRTISTFGASTLINTVPIWTAVFAALLLGERLAPRGYLGVALGFAGALIVGSRVGPDSHRALEVSDGALGGALAVLLAAMCQGLYFILLRSVVGRVGAGRSTAWTFLFATVLTAPFAATLGRELAAAGTAETWAIVYLGVVPGSLGVWTWSMAARRLPASRQAVFLYLVPPLTALIAWICLGESPALLTVIGGLIAVAGAAIAGARSPVRPRPRTRISDGISDDRPRRTLRPPAGCAAAPARGESASKPGS